MYTIIVLDGTVTLRSGARAESIVVLRGKVTLDAGSTVLRDVATLEATVDRAEGATVGGVVRGHEADVVGLGGLFGWAAVMLSVGFFLATLLGALLLAGLGARQVRSAIAVIRTEPAKVFFVGLLGLVAIPLAAILAMATVIGIPTGVALLLGVWPFLGLLGYLVTAVWIGEWLLLRTRGRTGGARPYLGAAVGVVALQLLTLVPIVGPLLTLFGFGAVVVAGWRVIRGPAGRASALPAMTAPMPA